MLTEQVVVATLAALGERLVVGFEPVDGAVIGDADQQGAAVLAVEEPGDGLDHGLLGDLGLARLCPDVPAQRRLVLELAVLAVGADEVADGASSLAGDSGSGVDAGQVLGDQRGPEFVVVEELGGDLLVAVEP